MEPLKTPSTSTLTDKEVLPNDFWNETTDRISKLNVPIESVEEEPDVEMNQQAPQVESAGAAEEELQSGRYAKKAKLILNPVGHDFFALSRKTAQVDLSFLHTEETRNRVGIIIEQAIEHFTAMTGFLEHSEFSDDGIHVYKFKERNPPNQTTTPQPTTPCPPPTTTTKPPEPETKRKIIENFRSGISLKYNFLAFPHNLSVLMPEASTNLIFKR